LDDVVDLYFQMIRKKKFKQHITKEFIERMCQKMGDNIYIIVARKDGIPASCAVILIMGDRAFYYLGASNEVGRKFSASYLIFDHISNWCRERGIRYFDTCGIDPLENYNTYRFKNRTGGETVEYIGEKEKASSRYAKLMFNFGVFQRGIGS